TVSLFDNEEEEDESDWNEPIFTLSKPTARNTSKEPAEERPQAKSTGVFQDEELLFSQTQQKDNDPDFDLFTTSGKTAKPAAQTLFAEDDEDDIFSSVKPKVPPKIAEKPSKPNDKPAPVKPKDSSSRIGKLQANLMINPAALLPGAVPNLPGAVSVLPGAAPNSSSGMSSPAMAPVGAQGDHTEGVSFDTPVQVTTLQSAHKSQTHFQPEKLQRLHTLRPVAMQNRKTTTKTPYHPFL
uniref:FAM21/CAPZIP domain-containing protein n=1 Tax=Mola mola TaxID=94237 RepID=A0A3Q3WMT9_MOLML